MPQGGACSHKKVHVWAKRKAQNDFALGSLGVIGRKPENRYSADGFAYN